MILSASEQSENENVVAEADAQLLVIKENLVNCGRELAWGLNEDTVKLLADGVYRDEVKHKMKVVDIGEGSALGTIDPGLKAMKKYLINSWIDKEKTVETIVCLLKHYRAPR